MERRSLKRLSLPLLKTCVKSGPFAPRALPRFLATMGRSDSRPRPPRGYGFPRGVAPPRRTTPGLPGPLLLLSTRALPTHPGQPDACMRSLLPHQLQASSSSADWPLPLVSRGRIGFAYAGLASSPSQLVSHSPGRTPDRPVSRSWLPASAGPGLHGERAIHMADTSQSARKSRVTLAQPTARRRCVQTDLSRALRDVVPSCSAKRNSFVPAAARRLGYIPTSSGEASPERAWIRAREGGEMPPPLVGGQ